MRRKQREHVSWIPCARHTLGRQKWQLRELQPSVCLSAAEGQPGAGEGRTPRPAASLCGTKGLPGMHPVRTL